MSRGGYAIKRRQFSSPIRVHRHVELYGSSLLSEVQPNTGVPPITMSLWLLWHLLTSAQSPRYHQTCYLSFRRVLWLPHRFQLDLNQTPVDTQTAA
ncbi:hypothetical protein ACKFKH_16140 [Phormidesmis sp. 146-20]